MKVGIFLPLESSDARPDLVASFARRAEEAGFATLSLLDRLIWENYDPQIAMAFAAGATSRIGLQTSILIAPLHPTVLLAKQLVSLDNLADGRLTVGVGLGGHPRDYEAAGVDWHKRGRILDAQLEELHRLWDGDSPYCQPAVTAFDRFGPKPLRSGGPRLLVGGAVKSVERAARYADGFICGWAAGIEEGHIVAYSGMTNGGTIGPDRFVDKVSAVHKAWSDAGRTDRPYVVATAYFSLMGNEEMPQHYLGRFYRHDEGLYDAALRATASAPERIIEILKTYEADGADEVHLVPATREPAELDRLVPVLAAAGYLTT